MSLGTFPEQTHFKSSSCKRFILEQVQTFNAVLWRDIWIDDNIIILHASSWFKLLQYLLIIQTQPVLLCVRCDSGWYLTINYWSGCNYITVDSSSYRPYGNGEFLQLILMQNGKGVKCPFLNLPHNIVPLGGDIVHLVINRTDSEALKSFHEQSSYFESPSH